MGWPVSRPSVASGDCSRIYFSLPFSGGGKGPQIFYFSVLHSWEATYEYTDSLLSDLLEGDGFPFTPGGQILGCFVSLVLGSRKH